MIRFAKDSDTPAVQILFDLCFPDESGFNAYYFAQHYRAERTLLFEQQGTLCAMLQMLPYQLSMNGIIGEATYIYGACTHPEHRRKHLMAQLLEASFQEDVRQGRFASMLIPQEDWLFEFYKPFGYEPTFTLERRTVLLSQTPEAVIRKLEDFCEAKKLYSKIMQKEPCYILRKDADWQAQTALFEALGAGAFGLYEENRLTAYAFVWPEEDGLFAQELLAEDERCAEILTQSLLRRLNRQKLVYCTAGDRQTLGCLKPYQSAPVRGYINLMFN